MGKSIIRVCVKYHIQHKVRQSTRVKTRVFMGQFSDTVLLPVSAGELIIARNGKISIADTVLPFLHYPPSFHPPPFTPYPPTHTHATERVEMFNFWLVIMQNQQRKELISARKTSADTTTKLRVVYGHSHLGCESIAGTQTLPEVHHFFSLSLTTTLNGCQAQD